MEFQKQRQTRADRRDDLDLGRPPAMPTLEKSTPLTVKQQIQKLLLGQAWAAHGAGFKGEGLSLALRAWMTDPLQLRAVEAARAHRDGRVAPAAGAVAQEQGEVARQRERLADRSEHAGGSF
jgi:hypothetical protein